MRPGFTDEWASDLIPVLRRFRAPGHERNYRFRHQLSMTSGSAPSGAQKRRVSKPSLRSRCSRNAFVAFPLWLPSSLRVERPNFYVTIRHKVSRKRLLALKSTNQDKRFRKAHKSSFRHCFLKVLRQRLRQQEPSAIHPPRTRFFYVPSACSLWTNLTGLKQCW